MSKKENANATQEQVYTSARGEMREDCLYSMFERSEALSVWKHREAARRLLKVVMILALIGGILGAVAVCFLVPNLEAEARTNYAITIAACALVLFILAAIIKASVNSSCKKTFVEYSAIDERTEVKLDALKRENLDPALENRIIICVRSILETAAQFVNEEFGDEEYRFVDESELTVKRINEPANSVLVTLDGHEVGALDLTSEFSMFRVDPGLHSLKLTIKKEYYDQGKTLVLQTPVNPIHVDGNYRIVYYAVQARYENDHLKYALKVYEYDDMITFMRDIHQSNALEKIEQSKDISRSLKKRAKKLSHLLDKEDPAIEKEKERALFGNEKVALDDLARQLQSVDHDVRFRRDPRIELYANVNSVSTIRREKKAEEPRT